MNAIVEHKLVRVPPWQLPPTLAERLRKMALDNFTGNVELNIKRGRICGFNVLEQVELPRHEIP